MTKAATTAVPRSARSRSPCRAAVQTWRRQSRNLGPVLLAALAALAVGERAAAVVISAKIEAEVALLADAAERREYLAQMGLEESGLARIVRAGYGLLGLITFFTATASAASAWTVRQGTLAPRAAAAIHGDFERGFIRAETIAFDDYVALGGEAAARDAGKLRQEGRNYPVADGDVIHFRFNV